MRAVHSVTSEHLKSPSTREGLPFLDDSAGRTRTQPDIEPDASRHR